MNVTDTTTLKMLIKTQARKLQDAQRNFCVSDGEKAKIRARLEKNITRHIEITGELPDWK